MQEKPMQDLLKFIFLAIRRKRSVEDYLEFQIFQAQQLLKKLAKLDIASAKKILDIGSGIGGYVSELARQYPEIEITSVDKNPLEFARKKYSGKIKIVNGDATILPFKTDSFDFVLASSVIEHIEDQNAVLSEISRVLKQKHLLYLSFPPFYSLFGGHSISPLHYLPGKLPFIIYSKLYKQKCDSFINYGLVRTTLASIEKKLRKNFTIVTISSRLIDFGRLLRTPILREFIGHHVEYILSNKK